MILEETDTRSKISSKASAGRSTHSNSISAIRSNETHETRDKSSQPESKCSILLYITSASLIETISVSKFSNADHHEIIKPKARPENVFEPGSMSYT